MTSLREQLGRFIAGLRAGGIRVSVAATLVKDEADRARFDEAFGRFFAVPASGTGRRRHPDHRGVMESSARGLGRPGESPPLLEQSGETQKKPLRDEATPSGKAR